jgi:glyceraldehyde-3-phosphate dehydrogenase/erythrose-4-phosphate dehydrogenase
LQKSRIAIVGFGHVGRGALEAIQESPDMEVAGIVELPQVIKPFILKPLLRSDNKVKVIVLGNYSEYF